ncbi:hypothetical protein [Georgenia sp. SUBG003]|uniref:hypothetical protein n=1 Tax=Georgenia sp. SUBG003 TaxID=1497974 RepID=UPI0004D7821E|nr:hypothetical protein DA06_08075 [Georgenia sp. SUBG003]
MFSKTVLNAVVTASAGAGILLVSGIPQAFGTVGAGAPVAPGAIHVEATQSTVASSGHGTGGELVVVPGETVTFTTSARVTVQGEGVSAVLRLDTGELFAVAPEPLRGELDDAVDVELDGLPPAPGDDNAWVVPARTEPYDVTAAPSPTTSPPSSPSRCRTSTAGRAGRCRRASSPGP